MKILIIGGTRFVGRHLTDAALARGHEVTLFNRGQSGPDVFPNVENLKGDRDGDLDALTGRTWDAVIDTCGYVPRVVGLSAKLLKDAVGQYVFISSISAYAARVEYTQKMRQSPQYGALASISPFSDDTDLGMDETAALSALPEGARSDPAVEAITNETYGPLKVLCENVVRETYPDHALIIRPGIIVGPYDASDRFTYLVARAAHGGEMLVPGPPDAPIQIIDARDMAEWIVRLVEQKTAGVFNACGPETPLTAEALLSATRTATSSDTTFTFVDGDWLTAQDVDPQSINIWTPFKEPEWKDGWRVSNARAMSAGLTFRPLAQIIRNTVAWSATRGPEYKMKIGLAPAREQELLAAWRKRKSVP